MKKIILTVAFAAAMIWGVNADEYRHISPVTIQLIEFNLDTMRNASEGNLALYLTQLSSLQTDLEKQGKEISEEQKNLKAEKKLYDTQVAFLKSRQAQVKNEKKFYEGEIKNYDAQLKNVKKQYEMIQKMSNVSSVAMQEQLSMLRDLENDCKDRKAEVSKLLQGVEKDNKVLDKAYEIMSQYLIEINDKSTRLENLATRNKADITTVKDQMKNIKAQEKAAK